MCRSILRNGLSSLLLLLTWLEDDELRYRDLEIEPSSQQARHLSVHLTTTRQNRAQQLGQIHATSPVGAQWARLETAEAWRDERLLPISDALDEAAVFLELNRAGSVITHDDTGPHLEHLHQRARHHRAMTKCKPKRIDTSTRLQLW